MFIRRSTYKRLRDRADAYGQAYVDARRAENRKADPGVARRTRLVQAVVRYRADLARKDRRIAYLQGQLDDLHGLNSDAIRQGERWQQRRPDKPMPEVSL